ncbi:MAG: hypothetical protein ACP5PQ_06655, partial [Thermoproteota archaeon]
IVVLLPMVVNPPGQLAPLHLLKENIQNLHLIEFCFIAYYGRLFTIHFSIRRRSTSDANWL